MERRSDIIKILKKIVIRVLIKGITTKIVASVYQTIQVQCPGSSPSEKQTGFRPGRSCVDCLSTLLIVIEPKVEFHIFIMGSGNNFRIKKEITPENRK